jgi:catechol 2,3-dioxygenase-like lactoylglutathione lyase family enzyme
MKLRGILLAAASMLLLPLVTGAQIAPANGAGVAAGHEHMRALDVDALKQFLHVLGASDGVVGKRSVLYVPGVVLLIIAPNPNAPANTELGGSEGTSVDSIGFRVKNLQDTLKKLGDAGYKPLSGATAKHVFIMAPNKAKVELVEDRHLATPVATDAVVMKVPDVAAGAAWYEKWFGAKIVRKHGELYAEIPGMNIRFEKAEQPVTGTTGRAIDHIGFEVDNLEAFMKKLGDGGVKITRPYTTQVPADVIPTLRSLALIEDPWGTSIELNEGFRGLK